MVQQEVRKGPWTEQEDFKLVYFVGLFGDRRWDFIAKVSGLKVAGDKKKKKSISNNRECLFGHARIVLWKKQHLTTSFCCRFE